MASSSERGSEIGEIDRGSEIEESTVLGKVEELQNLVDELQQAEKNRQNILLVAEKLKMSVFGWRQETEAAIWRNRELDHPSCCSSCSCDAAAQRSEEKAKKRLANRRRRSITSSESGSFSASSMSVHHYVKVHADGAQSVSEAMEDNGNRNGPKNCDSQPSVAKTYVVGFEGGETHEFYESAGPRPVPIIQASEVICDLSSVDSSHRWATSSESENRVTQSNEEQGIVEEFSQCEQCDNAEVDETSEKIPFEEIDRKSMEDELTERQKELMECAKELEEVREEIHAVREQLQDINQRACCQSSMPHCGFMRRMSSIFNRFKGCCNK